MHRLHFLLKVLLILAFVLFFSIIGINKKTIDSLENKVELENNIDTLRGIIWTNYTIIIVSLSISLTLIVAKKYYYKYKWTILFGIMFILLNTGLTVFEEITIRNYKEIDIVKLNNIYIISSVMNIIYFILFTRLLKITNDISFATKNYLNENLEKYMSVPFQDDEPEYFNGLYNNKYDDSIYNDMEQDRDSRTYIVSF